MSGRKRSAECIPGADKAGSSGIVIRNNSDFPLLWNNFLTVNRMPVYYSLEWLDFCKTNLKDNFVKDCTFLISDKADVAAIAPFIIEKGVYGPQASIKGGFLLRSPAFSMRLSEKIKKDAQKIVFAEIDKIASREGILLHKALIDPMHALDQTSPYNYLSEYGYYDRSILTNIIDLSLTEQGLWSNLRKSYKPLIKREKKRCELKILIADDCPDSLFDEFENLYFLASGKTVYTKTEWGMLRDLIKKDKGMLIIAGLNGKIIGGSYFNHSGQKAYYSLSANHPDFEKDFFISHLLIWRAIEYYLGRKFSWLELGWQFYREQFFDRPSEKEINISYFKRGFGGRSFPLYRGIKFFNEDIKEKYIKNCLENKHV